MNYWKNLILGALATLTFFSCYGEEDSFAVPSIYKDYQFTNTDDSGLAGYAVAPVKEAKYDEILNELYITWDGSNSTWEKRSEYVGAEVEFNSLLSGKKIKRVIIPNVGDFGNLTVKKRDYDNEPSTLHLSKYRTVVVTDRYGVDEFRFRSIYKDESGALQMSDWVKLSDQDVEVDKNYVAWQYFKSNVVNPVQVTFSTASSKPISALADLVGQGDEAKAKEEFQKWYYMDCAAMSFDPYNLAFDPYNTLDIHIADGVGVANAIDWPSHKAGRRINYEASVGNPSSDLWKLPDMQHVMMHEMGHCVEWMPKAGKYIKEGVQDCDRQGYQEGWPDAVKIASKGYNLATQKAEYQSAIQKSYRDPQSDKYFVWQIDYNTSGAFMSWLRLYNGDFVRMLPWTVLMDDLTDKWSLEDAVKYVLKDSYPNITMEELWNEYKTEVEAFLQNN
ncbi:hypothetical protein GGR21_002798 [Dysgonomonas hofstadii]|uniref:Plant Basic Secretory Protein n=1 Tax=Dysgonomonas hofstadii TaxID=637886 RepID=A0A840CVP1_9BACT|nr:hypothetical protein [Dysgonomonas hofstadii]MBB4036885.1 hypothetical protein [Dysgonomonas hofstadii]